MRYLLSPFPRFPPSRFEVHQPSNEREFKNVVAFSHRLYSNSPLPSLAMPHRVRSPDDPTARMRLAARAGKLSVLQKLLSREPSWRINEAREEDGWTALALTIAKGIAPRLSIVWGVEIEWMLKGVCASECVDLRLRASL